MNELSKRKINKITDELIETADTLTWCLNEKKFEDGSFPSHESLVNTVIRYHKSLKDTLLDLELLISKGFDV